MLYYITLYCYNALYYTDCIWNISYNLYRYRKYLMIALCKHQPFIIIYAFNVLYHHVLIFLTVSPDLPFIL